MYIFDVFAGVSALALTIVFVALSLAPLLIHSEDSR